MFPRFSKFLAEELTPDQKLVADHWSKDSRAEAISAHVIPKGQHRAVMSLDDPHDGAEEHVEAPKHISDHLEKHGYKVKNYKAGTVEDKHGRETKIGKALVATKAPKEYVDHVNGDPTRTASKKVHSNLEVVVSRHPYDVAGMSTDRGWTSCMRMGTPNPAAPDIKSKADVRTHLGGGLNDQYLPDEVKSGTHVAYLVNKGDREIKNPIARIALKPHTSADNTHTILRPEGTTYGSPASSFEHTVNKWAMKHFPMKEEHSTYTKSRDVYSDSSDRVIVNHTKLFNNPKLLHQIHSSDLSSIVQAMKDQGQLHQSHLDALWTHPVDNTSTSYRNIGKILAIRHGGDKEHMTALNSGKEFDNHVAERTKNPQIIAHIAQHSASATALQAVTEPNNYENSPTHVQEASKAAATVVAKRLKSTAHLAANKSPEWKNLASHLAIEHPQTHKHLVGLNNSVDRHIAKHSSDPEVLSGLVGHADQYVRHVAYANMHTPVEHKLKVLTHDNDENSQGHAANALQMHDLTPHLAGMTENARAEVASNTHHEGTQRKLTHDPSPSVAFAMAERNIHLDHFATIHPDPHVRGFAQLKLRNRLKGMPEGKATGWMNMHNPENVGKTYDEIVK